MRDQEKRIERLEAAWCEPDEPRIIELVCGPTITREEADAMETPAFPRGARVSRIVMVGVLPDADGVRF